MRTGRPSIYTDEITEEICERLEAGESILKITKDDHMPCRSTVGKWLAEKDDFSANYARAREFQADHYFEQCMEISDAPQYDAVQVQAARLRVDTRKWILARMNRAKYGDKASLDIETPQPLKIDAHVDVPDELRDGLKKLMEQHARRKE